MAEGLFMNATKETAQSIVTWLLNTGIRYVNEDKKLTAFYESYNKNKQAHSFIYCEITGYAINFLLGLYSRDKNNEYLEIAKRAGDFIIYYQSKSGISKGAVPWTIDSEGNPHSIYYSFDTAMCVNGLADLYKVTHDEKYLISAVSAADWLLRAQNTNGSFKAVYNAEKMSYDSKILEKTWSGDNGCLHIKHLIGLLKIYRLTKDKKYLESIKTLLNWSMEIQMQNGAFKAIPEEIYTFTHSHCYATEGLIYAYCYFKDDDYKKSIIKSSEWLLESQNRDGSIYDYYNLPIFFTKLINLKSFLKRVYTGLVRIDSNAVVRIKRTDAVAQAARIFLFAYLLTKNIKYLNAAKKALCFVKNMQSNSKNNNEKGAICFSLLDFGTTKIKSELYTSWSSMFGVNAMSYFDDIVKEKITETNTFAERLF